MFLREFFEKVNFEKTQQTSQKHDKISQHAKTSNTVKPVLSGHSKTDKTKVLKSNGSLMKVESIPECSLGAFCNTFDLH